MYRTTTRPAVGLGVIIVKGATVLIGKRLSAHGRGTWSFPGGHLEYNESVERGGLREVHEETGLRVRIIRRGPWTNNIYRAEKKHTVTLYLIAAYTGGEPRLTEPDKWAEWKWVRWNALPRPLFLPLHKLLETGFSPFKK